MIPHVLLEKIYEASRWATPFAGVCFRCVPFKFANELDIISGKGSITYGGRFNFIGKFEVLYLSCDIHTSIEETTKSQLHSGFEAILVPSAVMRGKNLDVFPDRLLEGSYLKVVNRNLLPPER